MKRLQQFATPALFFCVLTGLLLLLFFQLQRLPATSTTGDEQAIATLPTVLFTATPTASPVGTPSPLTTPTPVTTSTVDPFVLTLTAYPTFPPTPNGEILTRIAAAPGIAGTVIPPTPFPISKIINMAEGVAAVDIMFYIVQRADGTFEKYLIPDALLPGDETYKQVRNHLLNLGPQDVLVDAAPLDSLPKVQPQPLEMTLLPSVTISP